MVNMTMKAQTEAMEVKAEELHWPLGAFTGSLDKAEAERMKLTAEVRPDWWQIAMNIVDYQTKENKEQAEKIAEEEKERSKWELALGLNTDPCMGIHKLLTDHPNEEIPEDDQDDFREDGGRMTYKQFKIIMNPCNTLGG